MRYHINPETVTLGNLLTSEKIDFPRDIAFHAEDIKDKSSWCRYYTRKFKP